MLVREEQGVDPHVDKQPSAVWRHMRHTTPDKTRRLTCSKARKRPSMLLWNLPTKTRNKNARQGPRVSIPKTLRAPRGATSFMRLLTTSGRRIAPAAGGHKVFPTRITGAARANSLEKSKHNPGRLWTEIYRRTIIRLPVSEFSRRTSAPAALRWARSRWQTSSILSFAGRTSTTRSPS